MGGWRPTKLAQCERLGQSKEPARALWTGCWESSPRAVLNVPRWAPKGALYPTRCHRTLRASDLFALSESTGRAQVSTPQPRTQRARALPRSGSSQFMAPTPPAPFLLPILPGAGPCALILSPLPRVQEQREAPATSEPARGRPSGELACANKLYVVVFVTGVMISPSVIRVAALVPDPIQQIKDGGATYEMNELVFSPRYFNVVVTLPH